jgi:hypothetical protein
MPMTHAQAVKAGKKAARTRWGSDGKKGTAKSRSRKAKTTRKGHKGMSHAKAVAAGKKAAATRKRNKRKK